MAKANLRSRLVFGSETQIIATLQDLNEALHITHNMSGIPTYKTKFFRKTFIPCLSSKTDPDRSKDGSKEENVTAVTTRELCDYYKKVNGKTINTDNLRKTYLAELIDYVLSTSRIPSFTKDIRSILPSLICQAIQKN